jgi:hypothetical protein
VQTVGLCVWLAAIAACERGSSTASASPPAPATESPAATPTFIPTTTPTPTSTHALSLPATAILKSAVAVEPTARVPLVPGTEVVVDPDATFELDLSARSPDARLVLVDAREDLVPAVATRELSAATTRLTLTPSPPLVSGSQYALRVDGAVDRELHDDAGRGYGPITLPLLAAGTPPPPQPKKAPARKKKRR